MDPDVGVEPLETFERILERAQSADGPQQRLDQRALVADRDRDLAARPVDRDLDGLERLLEGAVDLACDVGQVTGQVGGGRPVVKHLRERPVVQRDGVAEQLPPRGLEVSAGLERAYQLAVHEDRAVLERDVDLAGVRELQAKRRLGAADGHLLRHDLAQLRVDGDGEDEGPEAQGENRPT